MAKRTGVPTLIKVAERMCQLIVTYSPVIQSLYPANTALQAALAAANAACQTLHNQLAEVREYGD